MVGEKRKQTEIEKPETRHKKRKVDKTIGTSDLKGEYFNLLKEALVEVSKQTMNK